MLFNVHKCQPLGLNKSNTTREVIFLHLQINRCFSPAPHICKELHKHLNFHNKFDLEGQGHQFQTLPKPSKTVQALKLNASNVPISQFKAIKLIYKAKLEGQFDLQGQGHQFLK